MRNARHYSQSGVVARLVWQGGLTCSCTVRAHDKCNPETVESIYSTYTGVRMGTVGKTDKGIKMKPG